MATDYPHIPHFLEGAVQQITDFRIGNHGRDLDQVVTIYKTTEDAGSSPVTTLRRGLVLGQLATGLFTDIVDADAPVGANAISSAAVIWTDLDDLTLIAAVCGDAPQTVTFGAAVADQAEALASINAVFYDVDGRLQAVAEGATKLKLQLVAPSIGSDYFFEVTGGTGVTALGLDLEPRRGTDMVVGILDEALDLLIAATGAATYDASPVRMAIAGKVETTKVFGLDGVNGLYAKDALRKTGVIFV